MNNHGKNDAAMSHLLDILNQATEMHNFDIPVGGRTLMSSIQLHSPLSHLPSSIFGGEYGSSIQHFVKQQPRTSSSSHSESPQLSPYPPILSIPASLPFVGDAGSIATRTAPSVPANPPKPEAKKRTWRKPKGKPKRPLSAYNLFFQSERKKLISQGKNSGSHQSPITQIPVTSPSNSSSASFGPKRRHRKTHGKIGFAALARNIASKWKGLDAESRASFSERATVEKERYMKDLEIWKRSQQEKERPKQAAQQQKESKESEQDGGRVPKDEPLQDQDQERSFELKGGQIRECQSLRKKWKLLPEPKEELESGTEGIIVVSGVLPPQTMKQKKIPEEDVIISILEAAEENTSVPVIGTGLPPKTTTEPPLLSLRRYLDAFDTNFEPNSVKTTMMNAFALTPMIEMGQSASAPFTSCQYSTREPEPNPSLHSPSASAAATAPSRATKFHQAKAPQQQQPLKKDYPPTCVVNQNNITNPAAMMSESLYMNELARNVDSIFDDGPSEGASAGASASPVNIEDPSLQQAFIPTDMMVGDRGMRDILSSLESLDAVLDDDFMEFIKGY